jgi:hypothetical protein
VLVSPDCPLRRKGKEWDQVVKMDMFEKQFMKPVDREGVLDTLAAISKFVGMDTLGRMAQSLIAGHKPSTFNFAAKFRITALPPIDDSRFAPSDSSAVKCESCATILETKVINFCRLNPGKVGAKMLCQPCQKTASHPGCDGCGSELEDKVVRFCRLNSRRFGGRKLCRPCQAAPISV